MARCSLSHLCYPLSQNATLNGKLFASPFRMCMATSQGGVRPAAATVPCDDVQTCVMAKVTVLQVAYASPEELWNSVSGQEDQSWYTPAVEYWDQQPASYDGVLAGGPMHGCCQHIQIVYTLIRHGLHHHLVFTR